MSQSDEQPIETQQTVWFKNESFYKNLLNLCTSISVIIIPIIVAYLAKSYESEYNNNKLSQEYTKIAVDILNSPPSDSKIKIREWAIDIINEYSKVKIHDDIKGSFISQSLGIQSAALQDFADKLASSSSHPIETIITWEGNPKDGYNFELEKKENNEWVSVLNICEVTYDNKKIEYLTKKEKYRWRVKNLTTNIQKDWQELTL